MAHTSQQVGPIPAAARQPGLAMPCSNALKKGENYDLPWDAAATGTGAAVEKINDRPLDCISCFHFLLFIDKSKDKNLKF